MAKYNIIVKANSDASCNGTRFTKDIPFPSTVINGTFWQSKRVFNNKIDYLSGDCSITVKGRFPTHKDSRKWFVVSPTEKRYEKD